MNLSLNSKIDKAATRKKMEKIFDRYQLMKLIIVEESAPSYTSQIQSVPTFSNSFHSKSESFVCKQEEAKEYIQMIENAVYRLPFDKERELIIFRYLSNEKVLESEVRDKIKVSDRTYYRYKENALVQLAYILQVVVYKQLLYMCTDCKKPIYEESSLFDETESYLRSLNVCKECADKKSKRNEKVEII